MNKYLQVWKAEAENICGYDGTVLVAVKTTKEKAPDKEKSDLLQEMQIMQKIGHHPNVVTLLGVTIDKGKAHYWILGKIQIISKPKQNFQTVSFCRAIFTSHGICDVWQTSNTSQRPEIQTKFFIPFH